MTVKTANNGEKSEMVDGYMVANCLQGLHAIFIHYFYLESCGDPTHDAHLNLCRRNVNLVVCTICVLNQMFEKV